LTTSSPNITTTGGGFANFFPGQTVTLSVSGGAALAGGTNTIQWIDRSTNNTLILSQNVTTGGSAGGTTLSIAGTVVIVETWT
jgi:hypothetical protein